MSQETYCAWKGLSHTGTLFILRTAKGRNGQLPPELQIGRQHNTFGDLLKSSNTSISEADSNSQLELNEFPHDADFAILVRERARGSKLAPVFRHHRGRILSESTHTLSLLRTGKATPRHPSKRDEAHVPNQADKQPPLNDQNTRRETTSQKAAGVIDQPSISVLKQTTAPQSVGHKDEARTRSKQSFHHVGWTMKSAAPISDSHNTQRMPLSLAMKNQNPSQLNQLTGRKHR